MATSDKIPIWLDCDPGHDDAVAILMALHLPQIQLLGISAVHGNASLHNTVRNAVRCLLAFGSKEQIERIPVYAGAAEPLIRISRVDNEIHGEDGLGGVEGLPASDDPRVFAKLDETKGRNAVLAIAAAARSLPADQKLTLVATGSFTNAALFVSMFPELVKTKLDQVVVMGGAEGRGNRSPTGESEYNILTDPHAASILLNAEIPVVMAASPPLNITHTAIFRSHDNETLLRAGTPNADKLVNETPATASSSSSPLKAHTPLRHTLHTLLNFFAATYKHVFSFNEGPPVHDALCIAYLARPDIFHAKRYRVDVELEGAYTQGTTVVDLYDYRKDELKDFIADPESRSSWGKFGKNALLLEELDVVEFWKLFQVCVDSADKVSMLNKAEK
ncbi:uridine nucleosidase [Rhodotorula sp. JG-1b]|nr:uridine nucleosidase [Rhodotorula sp. JG-1b]